MAEATVPVHDNVRTVAIQYMDANGARQALTSKTATATMRVEVTAYTSGSITVVMGA